MVFCILVVVTAKNVNGSMSSETLAERLRPRMDRKRFSPGIRVHTVANSRVFSNSNIPRSQAAADSLSKINPQFQYSGLCFEDNLEDDLVTAYLDDLATNMSSFLFSNSKSPKRYTTPGARAFARQVPLGRTVDLSCLPCDENSSLGSNWTWTLQNGSNVDKNIKANFLFSWLKRHLSPPGRSWYRINWTTESLDSVLDAASNSMVLF